MIGEGRAEVKGNEISAEWAKVFKKVVVEMKGDYDEEWKEEVVRELREVEEEKEDFPPV